MITAWEWAGYWSWVVSSCIVHSLGLYTLLLSLSLLFSLPLLSLSQSTRVFYSSLPHLIGEAGDEWAAVWCLVKLTEVKPWHSEKLLESGKSSRDFYGEDDKISRLLLCASLYACPLHPCKLTYSCYSIRKARVPCLIFFIYQFNLYLFIWSLVFLLLINNNRIFPSEKPLKHPWRHHSQTFQSIQIHPILLLWPQKNCYLLGW